jgi:DNA polymerase (family 10)
MINQELANIFYEIGYLLEIEEVAFKPQAYEKAAIVLESLAESVAQIYKKGETSALIAIPGIGKGIAKKIEEYLLTGKIKDYQELKKKFPVDIEGLMAVEGIGPKTIKKLYRELDIRNLNDLEKAIEEDKIVSLSGFDKKTEKNILESIRFLRKNKGRFLLGEVLPIIRDIKEPLINLKEVRELDLAGSLRRKKETIGDIDILVISNKPEKVMDIFVKTQGIIKIWGKGKTKSSIRVQPGIDVDLRVVPEKSYGSALQYFTGSKEHNIALRKIAIDKKMKLNEYGLFRGKKMIAGRDEKEIYFALGLAYIPAEMRENRGEIEMALENRIPKLIGYNDIKGDLHCHSNWDGGKNSIEEMAKVAINMDYEYLGISDHTKFLRIEHGLNEKQLSEQRKEIDKLNSKIQNSKFRLLQGAETNILK